MGSISINFIPDLQIIHRLEKSEFSWSSRFSLQKKDNTVNQIIHAILNSGRPIVLHNGMLDLCHIYRQWLYSRAINSNRLAYSIQWSLWARMTKRPKDSDNFVGISSSFEPTRNGFALYNKFPEVSLETFHQAWKSSTSFGQQFYILEDAPYSTGSFIDDEDLIWFDLRLCHLIGLFSGEPITSKNTFRDFLKQKF